MADVVQVLFGTETGTAEMCSSDLVDALKKGGWAAKQVDMDDYKIGDLPSEHLVVVITSTFGNGDPPANAENLLEGLRDDRPDLAALKFAVLALGDSSYPRFAQCGKDFFAILEELGGTPVIPRVDCDGDVDVPFASFQKDLLTHLGAHPETFPRGEVSEAPKKGVFARLKSWFGSEPEPPAATVPSPPSAPATGSTNATVIDRTHPGAGTLTSSRLLSKEGSTKETRHYTLDLGPDHGVVAGDSIGVYARNAPVLVDAVLDAVDLEGTNSVTWRGETTTLRDALATACLRRVTNRLLASFEGEGAAIAADGERFKTYHDEHHVLHALRDLHPSLTGQQLVDGLHPLAPRLYSVANDSRSGKVELVVETTRYTFKGVETAGVASCWFADQLETGATIPWYPHPNTAFHLPTSETPVIMVGPGTGVAPFRGFLQQAANDGLSKKMWLFFGHRNAACDDLYGDEMKALQESGVLDRYDTAWSRDQDERVYVQDRIRASSDDLWAWLEQGAVVMVCGAAVGMAPGVRQAFADVAAAHGKDGHAWLDSRVEAGTYIEDVY